ncbi:hypothetical protein FQZ97_950380 [compost metagenome]
MHALRAAGNVFQNRFLLECQWNDGVDVQAESIFDFLGIANAARQLGAKDCQRHAGEKAEHQRERNDQRLLRFDRALGFDGRVEQTHIADLSFLDETQLQRAVEQRLVEFAVDADVTLQPQGVPLYGGHGTHSSFEAIDFMVDGCNLTIHHADLRVGFGKARKQFAPLLLGF